MPLIARPMTTAAPICSSRAWPPSLSRTRKNSSRAAAAAPQAISAETATIDQFQRMPGTTSMAAMPR